MVLPVFGGRHRCTTALTSQHSDGSFVASVLKYRNVPTIRGSTNRISTGALRKLIENSRDRHLVMTPDGPRGPVRQMSNGIIYLSSRTGRGIVPSGFACSRFWTWKGSWSDLIIPKPFSTVVLLAGEPIYIPEGLGLKQLEPYRQSVQRAMDELDAVAEDELASPGSAGRYFATSADRSQSALLSCDGQSASTLRKAA